MVIHYGKTNLIFKKYCTRTICLYSRLKLPGKDQITQYSILSATYILYNIIIIHYNRRYRKHCRKHLSTDNVLLGYTLCKIVFVLWLRNYSVYNIYYHYYVIFNYLIKQYKNEVKLML